MKLLSALALACAGLAVSTAYAQPERVEEDRRIIIHTQAGPVETMERVDADNDGWVTRAEATAEADRMFAQMDTNNDGRLDDQDEGPFGGRPPGPPRGDGVREEPGQRIERHVRVIGGEGEPFDVMIHPPPHPPAIMILIAHSEESDTNGDGVMSREEFRAQQIRFFDAGDGNGDGRIRFETPPEMPPPTPLPPRR